MSRRGRDGPLGDRNAKPDGSRIAFTSGRDRNSDVYVIEVDGSEMVRLTDHEAADGRSIAFDSDRDEVEGDEIYVVSPGGSDVALVVGEGVFPTWSPDSKEILYTLEGLWAVEADGSGRRRLLEHAVYGAWSPDASTIAVAATEHDEDCRDHHSLVLLEPDAAVRKKLLPAE